MKEKLRILQIIHLVLCVGLVLTYIFLGNLLSIDALKLPEIDNSLLVYLLIPTLAILASRFMFKTVLNKIDSTLPMDEKITQYQSASIISWAIIEGAAFIILFLKPELILFGLLLLFYLFLIRPTEDKINNDLNNLTL